MSDQVGNQNVGFLMARLISVLVDEHKRVIYDLYGEKGLESFGMEVISRTKTPAEIIAEYERFQQEQEERRLRQRTNPKVTSRTYEPHCEKTGLRGFRPGPTQTGLYNH